MFSKLRTLCACHVQAAASSLSLLLAKPLASMITVFVIAITLTLPALFWVFSENIQQRMTDWRQGGHISLYLKSSVSSAQQIQLLNKIRVMPGVGQATLKSPEEGLIELQHQEGMQDIMRYLPENPLPAVIEVIPALHVDAPEKVESLFLRLKKLDQVEQAKLDLQWVNRLYAILEFVTSIAHGLMILLGFAVTFIIGNTLRLAIHHRHEEIQILKLIGATDPFILRPFLYSGIWYGLASSFLAIILVNLFLFSLSFAASQLASAYQMHYSFIGLSSRQVLLLILSAIVLGWLGARLTVKKQLASIEPYN